MQKLRKIDIATFTRVFLTLALFFTLLIYGVGFHISTSAQETQEHTTVITSKTESIVRVLNSPSKKELRQANERKKIEIERIKEEERIKKERDEKIQRVINFLARNGSPVANYDIAAIIIDQSAAYGADFRVVMAIMGVESGFCRASFWYNCFGYLNGVRYSSYYDAFSDLVPKVSRQYAAPFGWNFEGLAKAYGQHEWERTSANMYYYASRI